MPSLNTQEITEFNAIKTDLKALWDDCTILDDSCLFVPKGEDGKRVDLIRYISSIFNMKTVDNLLKFRELSYTITVKLLNSPNSETTKLKKLTIYRKMIGELIGKSYQKNDYNKLPYLLFSFPDNGALSGKLNLKYTRETQQKNTAENRIPMTKDILNQLIKQAIKDLRKTADTAREYGSKMLATELLIGRRQFEEILNSECSIQFKTNGFFDVKNLAKATQIKKDKVFTLPYLGKTFEEYDGELSDLLIENLKLLRQFADEKRQLKTPLPVSLNRAILQGSIDYDKILKPVRNVSSLKTIDGNSHFFRKLYAFSCYVFFDGCLSNESQYFAEVLAEGNLASDGNLKLNDITAKSYSIFRLVDSLD